MWFLRPNRVTTTALTGYQMNISVRFQLSEVKTYDVLSALKVLPTHFEIPGQRVSRAYLVQIAVN